MSNAIRRNSILSGSVGCLVVRCFNTQVVHVNSVHLRGLWAWPHQIFRFVFVYLRQWMRPLREMCFGYLADSIVHCKWCCYSLIFLCVGYFSNVFFYGKIHSLHTFQLDSYKYNVVHVHVHVYMIAPWSFIYLLPCIKQTWHKVMASIIEKLQIFFFFFAFSVAIFAVPKSGTRCAWPLNIKPKSKTSVSQFLSFRTIGVYIVATFPFVFHLLNRFVAKVFFLFHFISPSSPFS